MSARISAYRITVLAKAVYQLRYISASDPSTKLTVDIRGLTDDSIHVTSTNIRVDYRSGILTVSWTRY